MDLQSELIRASASHATGLVFSSDPRVECPAEKPWLAHQSLAPGPWKLSISPEHSGRKWLFLSDNVTREKCKSFTWCEDTTGAQVHGTARVRGHPCGASVHVYVGCSGPSAHGSGSVLAWRGRGTAAWRGLCGISLSGPTPPTPPTRPHIHTHSQLTNSIYKHRPSITQAAAESWRRQLLIGQSSSLWAASTVIYLSSGPGTGTWTRDRVQVQVQVGQWGGVCVDGVVQTEWPPPPRAWTPLPGPDGSWLNTKYTDKYLCFWVSFEALRISFKKFL